MFFILISIFLFFELIQCRVVLEGDLDLSLNRNDWSKLDHSKLQQTIGIPSIPIQIWLKWQNIEKLYV